MRTAPHLHHDHGSFTPERDPWAEAFASVLKRRREALGLKRATVAERSKLTRIAYDHIEAGRKLPNWPVTSRIAEVLECDLGELVGEVEGHVYALAAE